MKPTRAARFFPRKCHRPRSRAGPQKRREKCVAESAIVTLAALLCRSRRDRACAHTPRTRTARRTPEQGHATRAQTPLRVFDRATATPRARDAVRSARRCPNSRRRAGAWRSPDAWTPPRSPRSVASRAPPTSPPARSSAARTRFASVTHAFVHPRRGPRVRESWSPPRRRSEGRRLAEVPGEAPDGAAPDRGGGARHGHRAGAVPGGRDRGCAREDVHGAARPAEDHHADLRPTSRAPPRRPPPRAAIPRSSPSARARASKGTGKGNVPQVIRILPYDGDAQLVRVLQKQLANKETGVLSVPARLASGAAATCTATLLTYPSTSSDSGYRSTRT